MAINKDVKIRISSTSDGKGFKKAEKGLGSLKKAAKLAALAVGALGLARAFQESFKAAIQFESRMADISTLISGDSTQAVGEFKDGIKSLLKYIPKTADDLGASAYQIVSAGISDTSEALKVLEASSKLAVAGLGTTEEATDLMTGALNAFKSQGVSAEQAANILFKTVKGGKTSVAQLSQAFGQIAPIAATVGVRLDEMQAATAALTTANIPTSIAQNQLRSVMTALIKPTKEMAGLLSTLGVESGTSAIKQFGLVGTMEKLSEAAGGNEEILAKALGRVEGLGAVLALTGEQAGAFSTIMADMKDESDAVNEAFKKQTETFEKQWQVLKNQLGIAGMDMAERVMPALTSAMTKFNEMGGISQVFEDAKTSIVGLAISVEEKTHIFEYLHGLWVSIKEQIVKDLMPAFRNLLKAMAPLKPFAEAFAQVLGVVLYGAFVLVTTALTFLIKVFIKLITWGTKVATAITTVVAGAFTFIQGVIEGVASAIEKLIGLFERMIALAKRAMSAVSGFGSSVMGAVSSGISYVTGSRASGGLVSSGRPFMVGERGPEVFVPQGYGRIGQTGAMVTINISGNSFMGQEGVAEQIGNEIMRSIKDNVRL
jgi:TP901 family phage tail tape measure protein